MAKNNGNKKNAGKRQHSFLLAVCFISLTIFFVIALISANKKIQSRKEDVAQMQSKVVSQQAENEELQSMVDGSDQDSYIEKVAREEYGYIRPGDRVYKDAAAGE